MLGVLAVRGLTPSASDADTKPPSVGVLVQCSAGTSKPTLYATTGAAGLDGYGDGWQGRCGYALGVFSSAQLSLWDVHLPLRWAREGALGWPSGPRVVYSVNCV